MFNFEKWSQDLYELIDSMEDVKSNGQDLSIYQKELEQKWDELFQQENDMFVQFLKQLLSMTKEVVNGEGEQEGLERLVNDMRSSTLLGN
ncbi:hypothetical protein JMM81_10515 [Bacillus sp. V3B]|uniref:hypothetical protein n=1 Tax=Bacillus sp. V3B TaxID=2804915 RepID=UPI002109264C|nr:hypothetical protein [Bacillus sp. V3B]MCQ6275394.1 hypothetical protein [Bacillus sp. V3B]